METAEKKTQEVQLEKKPWWVSDQEKGGLTCIPTPYEDPNKAKEFGAELGKEVHGAVPQMKILSLSNIICEYGEKDGLLNYHLYYPIRYSIRMDAEGELETVRLSNLKPAEKEQAQQKIADAANKELAEHPWPSDILEKVTAVFQQVFKYQEFKVTFFEEVDSVSVVMPKPQKGVVTTALLEEPLVALDQRMSQG